MCHPFTLLDVIDLKMKYFLEDDLDQKTELVIWGAGKKGKLISKILIEKGIPFRWICNNENKIGVDIYGKILESPSIFENISTYQIIIAVAQENAQAQILKNLEKIQNAQPYFFC